MGISFTLIGHNVYHDISTLPPKGTISIRKTNIRTGLEEQEDYPMPDEIREIIYDYGECLYNETK